MAKKTGKIERSDEILIASIVVALLIGSLIAFIAIFVSNIDGTTKEISYIIIALFIYIIWNELHKKFFLNGSSRK